MTINSSLVGKVTIIYALGDPDSGIVRYVGKTSGSLTRRVATHMSVARRRGGKRHVAAWLRSLDNEGKQPLVYILDHAPIDGDWALVEQQWIAHYRHYGDLTNHTDGGEGTPGRFGWHHSDATKAKIAASKALNPRAQIIRDQVGLGNRGSKNGQAKLTETAVQSMKIIFTTTTLSDVELAQQFGVSRALIRHIRIGQRWAHILAPSY